MRNLNSNEQINYFEIVNVITPDNHSVELKIILNKNIQSIKKRHKAQKLVNESEFDDLDLFLLENKNILLTYTSQTSILFNSKEDYDKVYDHSRFKEFNLFHERINFKLHSFYSFDLKLNYIEKFIEKTESIVLDTNFKVNTFEKVYFINNESYIILNDKRNSLQWFPDKLNFEGVYNLSYKM